MPRNSKTWRCYEELAPHVLRCFADLLGVSEVEAKQRVMGANTQWEIDAKGIVADGFLLIECRERTTTRLNQDALAAIAFKVKDTGANGAVIVTSVGLQKGAMKIAKSYDFKIVYLPKESTFEQFFASCGNRLLLKFTENFSAHFSLKSCA